MRPALVNSSAATHPGEPGHSEEVAQRYHSLDFLRGSMMLLGIVFHSALAYDSLAGVEYKFWPTSDALAYLVVGSHGFRMPIFFIIAGFFAALLYSRRSPSTFVTNRAVRIGVPLAAGWAILAPVAGAGLVFSVAAYLLDKNVALDLAWNMTKEGQFFLQDSTIHLWFLYYLLLLYAALLLTVPLARRLAARLDLGSWGGPSYLLSRWWRIPALVLPTIAILYWRPMADFETPNAFTPEVDFLLLYGSFFGFGVLLYAARGTITSFQRGAWPSLLTGMLLIGIYKLLVERWFEGGANAGGRDFLLVTAVNALMIWFLFFGLVGVLQRYLERPIPAVRYVADASYWFYLIHYPLVVWMPGLLVDQNWGPEAKFAVVVLSVTAICFVTYELFVRWTYVGTILNGRRYRSMFRLRRQPAMSLEAAGIQTASRQA